MKTLLLLFLSFTGGFMQAMEQPSSLTVAYDPCINKLKPYLEELRSARTANEETQAQMFALFKELFPLEKAVATIAALNNPQVVIWFTNYFGSIMPSTALWYSTNLFNKIPQATFWLTDLRAWCFLAIDKKQLSQNYSALIAKLDNNEQLKQEECPLTTKRSEVLAKVTCTKKRYRPLFSQDFFKALTNKTEEFSLFELILDKADLLCKTQRREGRAPCSLQNLGYTSPLLDIVSTKLARQTFLTADFTLIFRLLQYLEGLYYASNIIKDTLTNDPSAKECSIVFFIPNKEFTYYLVPQEQSLLSTFKQDLETVISTFSLPPGFRISVYFQPFAYYTPQDNTLFASPYRAVGNPCNKSKLEKYLP